MKPCGEITAQFWRGLGCWVVSIAAVEGTSVEKWQLTACLVLHEWQLCACCCNLEVALQMHIKCRMHQMLFAVAVAMTSLGVK